MRRIFSKEPEFYGYYNGIEDYPNESLLRLSDAFMTKPEHIPLELEVKVLNINEHKGNKILQSCKPLAEYSIFVETVRRNIEQDKEHGFEKAIKECIRNGILKEYLQRKAKEVINMLIAEYDYATDIAVQQHLDYYESLEHGQLSNIRALYNDFAQYL